MMKKVVGVLLKYFAGFFPQSMERDSFREQKLQLCEGFKKIHNNKQNTNEFASSLYTHKFVATSSVGDS